MYIPDEWEPAEWDEITGKQDRRFVREKRKHSCLLSMGSHSERGNTLHVPDMPGKLDGHGSGTATQVRESKSTSCLVVQGPAQEEAETAAKPCARPTTSGFFSPLPEIAEADEENPGYVLEDSRGVEGHGFADGVRGALSTAETSGKVHAGAEGI